MQIREASPEDAAAACIVLKRSVAELCEDDHRNDPSILARSPGNKTARNSDIDLVLLTTNPRAFRADTTWLDAIKWSTIGARPMKWEDEEYGELWSRRLWLEKKGGEVELGFASLSWADTNPVDLETQRVIVDGCRITVMFCARPGN